MSRDIGHWEKLAGPVIDRTIRLNPTADEKALRAALSKAYPFGERRHWPYKVWCRLVRIAIAIRFPNPAQAEARRKRAASVYSADHPYLFPEHP